HIAHSGSKCWSYSDARTGSNAVAVNGEDPVLVEQRFREGDIIIVRCATANPEGRDRPVQGRIVRRQYLNLIQRAQRCLPTVAQRPQSSRSAGASNRLLKGERGGDRQLCCVIDRSGMNPALDLYARG